MSAPPVRCPRCGVPAYLWCVTRSLELARRSHKARKRLAAAIEGHTDPALAGLGLGPTSPCGFCSVLPQRHRVVDAIAARLAVGETAAELGEEFGVSAAAVKAVREWAARHPEAWS